MILRDARPAVQVIELDKVEVTVRRRKGVRRLTLRMAAGSGAMSLTAPLKANDQQIRRFLEAHSGWIESRLSALPPVLRPVPGAVMTVGGQDLRLIQGQGRKVVLQGDQLLVPGSEQTFAARFRVWLKEQARQRGLAACDRYATQLDRSYGKLTLRDPRSRWGSCSSQGNLMLSWRLVLAPPEVLDYVAAHEVAHLVEMNHAPRFWAVVARLMPDYQAHRDWLKAHGAGLHRYQI